MPTLTQDLRHATRALLKHPGYLVTAVLTLALGIGFSTATFSVINAVLLRPLPYGQPDRLVVLRERKLPQFPEFSVAPGHYLAWRDQTSAFEGIGSFGTNLVNVDAGNADPERLRADRVTANLFSVLRVSPILGRAFADADDRDGAPPVVMLSYAMWQRRFGGRADAIGQTVRIDRTPVTIVGVMPPDFRFPSTDTEMWIPMAFSEQEKTRFGSHYLGSVGRLKDTVTLDRARSDINTVAARLSATNSASLGWDVIVSPLQEYVVRNVKLALYVLLGAVAMVLLIGCVNVANLLLARGAARQKELAIRSAIGASRGRLIRQLLVEQVALAAFSAAVGLLFAAWLLRGLLALLPNALPRQADIGLDANVLLFALALTILTPLLFGLFPAVRASRPDLRELIAIGGRQAGHAAGQGIRRALVVAEVALAMMLLTGAALLIRSFGKLAAVSPGFAIDRTIVASVSLPESRYKEAAQRDGFFGDLVTRTSALPRVTAVGLTQSVPMLNDYVSGFQIEGRTVPDQNSPTTNFYAVNAGYFDAMRIPVLRGRGISVNDRAGATRVIVINETLANRYFPSENPIGKRLQVSQGPSDWREIIGVVGDVKQYGLGERTPAQVYESYLQHPYFNTLSLVVRTTADDPNAIVPDLRAVVRSLDRELPLSRVRRLDDVVSATIRPQRFSAVLIAMFSGAALLLAAIGVYGVVSYTVRLRTQEFAIRIAHGASRSDILGLVLRGAVSMAATGVAAGLLAAWLLRQLVEKLLFGIAADDLTTYGTVALLLALLTIAASIIPALRATHVNPLTALREQ